MAMRLLVSVVVHCGCDGHASPDLSPTNQTARKTERVTHQEACSDTAARNICANTTHISALTLTASVSPHVCSERSSLRPLCTPG